MALNPLIPPQPQQNPLVPPGANAPPMDPAIMAKMGAQNPFAPPPPIASSPSLGFQHYASDPLNQMKIAHTMTPPDQPLQPNAPPSQPMAAVAPPRLNPDVADKATGDSPQAGPHTLSGPMAFTAANKTAPTAQPMASVAPPPTSAQSALVPPGGFKQQIAQTAANVGAQPTPDVMAPTNLPASAVAPTITTTPRVGFDQLGHDQDVLRQYQTEGAGLNKIQNKPLRVLSRIGDIAGTILAPGVMSALPGTTVHNWGLQNQQMGKIAQDQSAQEAAQKQQLDQANIAHTQAETAAIPINAGQKRQTYLAALAGKGLMEDKDGNIVPDRNSPAYQQQQLQEGLIKAHTDNFNASTELKSAQAEFERTKNDPNSPAYKLAARRLAVARQNAAAAGERAQAYMGRYMQSAYNVGLDGQTLAGAPIIANDNGDQTVVGTANADTAIKNQSNAAQFNDVHGALDTVENAARALIAKGGKLNSPAVAMALAQPAGTLGQWLQGAGVKANLSPEERQYVQAVSQAHENIQALRKSAGGTATDSAVAKLDGMIPNASTPDLNYLLGQTGQIRATAERLGKGATTATGGLTVRGQTGNPLKPPVKAGPPAPNAPKSYAQTATGPKGHKIGSNDGANWFDIQTGKAVK